MNKRKHIFNKIRKSIKKDPSRITDESHNIKKEDGEKEPDFEHKVPEEYKKRMQGVSKEELIAELFFTKYELAHVKRELEILTFQLTKQQQEKEG